MALYLRPESSLWHYEFRAANKRYRGSTRTSDKVQAAAYAAALRAQIERDAVQAAENAEQATSARCLYDVAQSWLAQSALTLRDHKGNVSRVRKLFRREMRLIGDTWAEVDSGRFGLQQDAQVRDITPELLAQLTAARTSEGASTGTIDREISLLRVLVAHAHKLGQLPVEIAPMKPLELVIKGRRSLKKLGLLSSPSGRKRTPVERRELWRDVGVALVQGRINRPLDKDFNEWCRCASFTLNETQREGAMWLTRNWGKVEHFMPQIWDPVSLRRRHEQSC